MKVTNSLMILSGPEIFNFLPKVLHHEKNIGLNCTSRKRYLVNTMHDFGIARHRRVDRDAFITPRSCLRFPGLHPGTGFYCLRHRTFDSFVWLYAFRSGYILMRSTVGCRVAVLIIAAARGCYRPKTVATRLR